MDIQNNQTNNSKTRTMSFAVGAIFISVGVLVLLGQYFNNILVLLAVAPAAGLVLLIKGITCRNMGFTIPGALVTGAGFGLVLSIGALKTMPVLPRIGVAFLCFFMGWVIIALSYRLLRGKTAWWAILAGAPFASMGACFVFSPLRWVDYVLYPILGIGLAFLAWGLARRLLGLIIPGSLFSCIGPGIFIAWQGEGDFNGLTETGVMLVCFAIGWVLITFFSKLVYQKFIWWPLIPGGVLAMVGWGLYIGGSPDNALGFIGNTGSIGLIIFGLYLLLLKRGIHQ